MYLYNSSTSKCFNRQKKKKIHVSINTQYLSSRNLWTVAYNIRRGKHIHHNSPMNVLSLMLLDRYEYMNTKHCVLLLLCIIVSRPWVWGVGMSLSISSPLFSNFANCPLGQIYFPVKKNKYCDQFLKLFSWIYFTSTVPANT